MDPVMENRSECLNDLLLMYETVLEIGPGGRVVPGLATDWSLAPDNLIWTFHLRKGVQFHQGWGELTTDDVQFSLSCWANSSGANSEFDILDQVLPA
jgi:peptide/nickel transport system substrate-binding protein